MLRQIKRVFLVVFLTSLLVANSSTSPSNYNAKWEELKAELNLLRVKVDLLEIKTDEKVNILTLKILKQEEEIIKLKSTIDFKQKYEKSSQKYENSSDRSRNERELHSAKNNMTNKDGSFSKTVIPSSCKELSLIGHSLDGLYLVRNQETSKIETAFCDFETSVSQEVIGNIDVKTKSVHFYVQRNNIFETFNAVIPFELVRLNEGGAMDIDSGIFTAPVPGIYHFEFSCVKDHSSTALYIYLQLNGDNVGMTYTDLTYTNPKVTGSYEIVSMTASLRLKTSDRVNLYNYGDRKLYDDNNHLTHFTGWLVEENLI